MSNDVGYGVCPICGSTMTPMGCIMGDQCQYRGAANEILDFFGIGDDDSTDDSSNATTPDTTTPPSSEGETPLALTHSNYKGHQLSVKPDSVEHVCNYLRNDVCSELDEMSKAVNDAYKSVYDYATSSPYPVSVPAGFDKSAATAAITTANQVCEDAATQVSNIADAIRQYGEGGWNTPSSVLKHLNDFLGLTSGTPAGLGTGGGNDSKTDDILDMDPVEEAIDTNGEIINGYETVGDDNDVLTEEIMVSNIGDFSDSTSETLLSGDEETLVDEVIDNSELSSSILNSNSSFVLPSPAVSEMSGTKSSSVLNSVGLAAAAAVAIGGKIYYDVKNDDNDSDDENNEDDDDEESSNRFSFVENTGADAVNVEIKSGLNMVEMKKALFRIGEDNDN